MRNRTVRRVVPVPPAAAAPSLSTALESTRDCDVEADFMAARHAADAEYDRAKSSKQHELTNAYLAAGRTVLKKKIDNNASAVATRERHGEMIRQLGLALRRREAEAKVVLAAFEEVRAENEWLRRGGRGPPPARRDPSLAPGVGYGGPDTRLGMTNGSGGGGGGGGGGRSGTAGGGLRETGTAHATGMPPFRRGGGSRGVSRSGALGGGAAVGATGDEDGAGSGGSGRGVGTGAPRDSGCSSSGEATIMFNDHEPFPPLLESAAGLQARTGNGINSLVHGSGGPAGNGNGSRGPSAGAGAGVGSMRVQNHASHGMRSFQSHAGMPRGIMPPLRPNNQHVYQHQHQQPLENQHISQRHQQHHQQSHPHNHQQHHHHLQSQQQHQETMDEYSGGPYQGGVYVSGSYEVGGTAPSFYNDGFEGDTPVTARGTPAPLIPPVEYENGLQRDTHGGNPSA